MSKPTHTLEERLNEKQEQLQKMLEKAKQYEQQLKQLEAKKKEEDRKARAHRLIELGASVESVLGIPIEGKEVLTKLMDFLAELEGNGNQVSRALGLNSFSAISEKSESDSAGF